MQEKAQRDRKPNYKENDRPNTSTENGNGRGRGRGGSYRGKTSFTNQRDYQLDYEPTHDARPDTRADRERTRPDTRPRYNERERREYTDSKPRYVDKHGQNEHYTDESRYNNGSNYNNSISNYRPRRNQDDDEHYANYREREDKPVENPYKEYVFLEKKDITSDTKIPSCPEKPEMLNEDDKDKKLNELDGELKKLENRKKELISKLQELTQKVRSKKKPEEVKEAELRKRQLTDARRNILDELRPLNKQLGDIKGTISSFDDQKPDKFKRNRILPQDEEELDFLISGFDEFYETHSLSKTDEEDILKRVNDLEKMRPTLGDVNNLNKEIVALKRRQGSIRSRTAELKEKLTSINSEIEDCDVVIDEYRERNTEANQGDTDQINKIRGELDKLSDSVKSRRKEKNKLFDSFRSQKRVMDYWKDVKRNVDYVKRTVEYLKKQQERDVKVQQDEKERKKNQMNQYELKITQATSAKNQLLECARQSSKKVVLKIETIQLFNYLNLPNYPKTKDDITAIISNLDSIIADQTKLNAEELQK